MLLELTELVHTSPGFEPEFHDRSSDAPLTEPMRTTFLLYKIHNVLFFNRPQPSITWYRNDATPGSRHDSVPLATGYRLTLHAAKVTDSGVYRCVATQRGGSHPRTLEFNVFIRGVLARATITTVVPRQPTVGRLRNYAEKTVW